MSLLPDHEIRAAIASGSIGLDPFDPCLVQPASIDVRLGTMFSEWLGGNAIDPYAEPRMQRWNAARVDAFVLAPAGFALGCTLERLTLPADIAAQVSGRSSLARLGLAVHVTAGWVDPGWDGVLTLELVNCAPRPIRLYPGMRIAQLSFWRLSSPAERPYGHTSLHSKYAGATGVQASRLHEEFRS